ncbi:MAG: hypothetical protein A2854_04990 [Parcubacteria group bacterium RIFCSPHIGHO2_01_FULL_56_18]|nr:MAG: hypothetical protein A2854_04990 [Parcubacteria group bacterium RIFCSPHIGHO2_01_FULL_56_18]
MMKVSGLDMNIRLSLLFFLLVPSMALAATPRTFSELAELSVNFLNAGIGTAIVLGLVIYFYGVASGISSLRHGESEQLRLRIVWGIIAIFVMVSVWGIIGLVRNTLFGGGGGSGGFGNDGEPRCLNIECL